MKLRYYQAEARDAVYDYLESKPGNPCVVIPTGGGKTPLISSICNDVAGEWGGRVVVLAHVKELLEQTAQDLHKLAPQLPLGIYSAGLRRRDLNYAVTVAGIQSIFKRAGDLGAVNLILVDEAHMVPTEDDGMYRQFLADAKIVNPRVRIVGLTATPYRLKAGMICGPENIFTDICYEVGVAKLIDEGFLSPLVTKGGVKKPDTDKLHLRGGEFIPQEVEQLMLDPQLVLGAVDELVRWTENRRSVLIFASGIKHAEAIVASMKHRHDLECGIITGETDDLNRAAMIDRFKAGKLRYLVNVNVLTTGFNAPNVDAVCLIRPTCSPGLYYQMVGRGFRLFPDKRDCLVLDFGGNVERHGPVDRIKVRAPSSSGKCAPVCKQCPTCQGFVLAGVLTCPDCGHEFPPPVRGEHEAEAAETGILSSQVTIEQKRVQEVGYYAHQKKNAPDAPPTMRVEYRIGFNERVSEWICFEHSGWPRNAAEIWWKRRSLEPVPSTVEMAVELARAGALAQTHEIKIERKPGEKWPSLKGYVLGATPPRLESSDNLPEVPAGDFAPDADAAYPSADEVPF